MPYSKEIDIIPKRNKMAITFNIITPPVLDVHSIR